MIELIITDRLHRKIGAEEDLHRLITMRPLTKKEIALAREMGIRRLYLPSLTEAESSDLLREFDSFWDQVIKPFDADHPFWRNVVSSKMQEWESSAAYFALILYTLARRATKESPFIVIVCSSLEEEELCEEWGRKIGWKVYRRPYLSLPYWGRRIVQEIWNLKSFLYMFSVCLYQKWLFPKYEPKSPVTNTRVLVTSLFYKGCFKKGEYRDPFFGNLHNIIDQNGNSVTYLCSPLGNFRESAREIRECNEVSILVPFSMITWSQLILLGLKVLIRRFRLPQTDFGGCDFSRLITWNVRRFDYGFNLHAEICYAAVKELCKREHFNRLIQLYEGNVFERGCMQAFRKYGSGPIVGYSHAVVFPLNLKIRLTDNEKEQRPEPDVFVSTGPETKRLMAKIGNRESTRIYAGCSLRYIPVSRNTKKEQTGQLNILVALDGVRSSITVLDWLIEHAESLEDYKVNLRAHPNMPMRTLLSQCLYDMPGNFYLSDGDLKEDIENCYCVIYRQTSVGIQALMNGVPVVHLDIDAPLPCDPIMNLESSKWAVRTRGELLTALKEIHSLDGERKRRLISSAKKYSKDYFTSPDDKNILRIFM